MLLYRDSSCGGKKRRCRHELHAGILPAQATQATERHGQPCAGHTKERRQIAGCRVAASLFPPLPQHRCMLPDCCMLIGATSVCTACSLIK